MPASSTKMGVFWTLVAGVSRTPTAALVRARGAASLEKVSVGLASKLLEVAPGRHETGNYARLGGFGVSARTPRGAARGQGFVPIPRVGASEKRLITECLE